MAATTAAIRLLRACTVMVESSRSRSSVLRALCQAALGVVPSAYHAVVYLYNPSAGALLVAERLGNGPELAPSLRPGQGTIGRVFAGGGPVYRAGMVCAALPATGCLAVWTSAAPEEGPGQVLEDVSLLAQQAAAMLQQQAGLHHLEWAGRVRQAMTILVAEGHRLDLCVAELAALLQRPVLLEDDGFERLAAARWEGAGGGTPHRLFSKEVFLRLAESHSEPLLLVPGPVTGLSSARLIMPVRAGETLFGYLTTAQEDGRPLDDMDRTALAQSAPVLALEMLRQQAVERAEWKERADLAAALCRGPVNEETLGRAVAFGYDPQRPFAVLALTTATIQSDGDRTEPQVLARLTQRQVASSFPRSLVLTPHRGPLVVLLALPIHPNSGRVHRDLAPFLQRLEGDLKRRLPWARLLAGLGRTCTQLGDFPVSLQEANRALQIGRRLRLDTRLVDYESLGAERLLLQVADPQELDAFAQRILGRLTDEDSRGRSQFLNTLRTYLANNQHLGRTAQALFIHVNTLNYRLQKIEELTGLDLQSGDDLLNLQVALRIHQLREAAGDGTSPTLV